MMLTSQSVLAGEQQWKALRMLTFYRLTLTGLFTVLYFTGSSPQLLGSSNPLLFQIVTITYLLFALASGMTARWRSPDFELQAYSQVFLDIIAITLLMHASSGPSSGLGTLLIVTIAAGSLLIPGQMAFLFAAIATIAIFTEQAYAYINLKLQIFPFTRIGILGATFFATALFAHILAKRARESEQLATQRGIDLANMAQLNEHIIQHLQSGIIVIDNKRKIHLMNSSAWNMLGMPTPYEHEQLTHVSPELYASLKQWLLPQNNQVTKPFHPTKGHTEILPRFEQVSDSGILILLEDMTKLNQRTQQMKLASLGRLTASIAHEIRNPLGAISHAGQLLNESPNLPAADQRLTQIIKMQSGRINTIIENILQLSRQSNSHPQQFELNAWLQQNISEFVQTTATPENCIEFIPLTGPIVINMDPSHLQQILFNLLQNALHHGQSDHTPQITIQTETPPKHPPYMDVIDYGQQIPDDMIEQIFEPFFTTSNQGTGLGLYITATLCEMNQAHLEYLPAPTGGSCFRISFSTPN